jgi:hypothetical protein
LENFNSNIKAAKPKKKQGEKMTTEEKSSCAKKRTWLDFVKRILSATKLFDDEKPKTKMLCIEVDYLKLCDLVANKIYSSVFLSKKVFEQAEESEDFEFNFTITGKSIYL